MDDPLMAEHRTPDHPPADVPPAGLLPPGLGDLLPPDAEREAAIIQHLMSALALFGYVRIKPPLVEFEDGILSGPGAALATRTFRLMDPVSRHMLAVRPDMTLQVARIAATRLAHLPRPLRLAYAGEVLRVTGTQMRPERQFGQVGIELLGSIAPEADAEVILSAHEALTGLGVAGLSADLCLPTLVPALCRHLALDPPVEASLRSALDRKDAAAVAAVGGEAADLAASLMAASGPAETALGALQSVPLPSAAEADRDRLAATIRILRAAAPGLRLTVDAVDRRGFEYQTGLSFTFFAHGVRGEVGRGGRYRVGGDAGEPATGLTLYTDVLLRAVEGSPHHRRVIVAADAPWDRVQALRALGLVTVRALPDQGAVADQGRRADCTHSLVPGVDEPVAL